MFSKVADRYFHPILEDSSKVGFTTRGYQLFVASAGVALIPLTIDKKVSL